MREVHLVPHRVKALARCPAHREAITMRRHLHQAFCGVAGNDSHPTVVWQQARPCLNGSSHGENLVNVPTDIDAVFRMHKCYTTLNILYAFTAGVQVTSSPAAPQA